MVFEVMGSSTTTLTDPTVGEPALARTALHDPDLDDTALDERMLDDAATLEELEELVAVAGPAPEVIAAPETVSCVPPAAARTRRPLPAGVVRQLLRSAVTLQAEGVLRTAGALAGAWGGVLDRTEWLERDARDLGVLAAAAVAADVPLPAGVDTGAGDPDSPGSVVESLLAGHEALVHVLRQLAEAPMPAGPDGDCTDGPSWRSAVVEILGRREEEIVLLRAVGAVGDLPADERYVHGRPPRV